MARAPRSFAALIVVALVLASVAILGTPRPVAAWSNDTFSTADEDLLIQLTNQARVSAGRAPLRVNSALHSLAQSRSKDMVDRDYFSHNIPPDGHLVFSDMTALGIKYSWAAENIGWNTYSDSTATQSMFNWFKGSSAHWANMMDSRATDIGVGAYKGTLMGNANAHVYTMLFIQAPGATATPTPQPTARPTVAPTAAPTPQPTAAPTHQPTAAPTHQPTAAPTQQPAAAPTVSATAAPTTEPTATEGPTAEPTAAPTAEPIPDASPTPTYPETALSAVASSSTPDSQPDLPDASLQASVWEDPNLGIGLLGAPILLGGLFFGLGLLMYRRWP